MEKITFEREKKRVYGNGFAGTDERVLLGEINNLWLSTDQEREIAEYIVKACNSHYELLEALRLARLFMTDDVSSELLELAGMSAEDAANAVTNAIEKTK